MNLGTKRKRSVAARRLGRLVALGVAFVPGAAWAAERASAIWRFRIGRAGATCWLCLGLLLTSLTLGAADSPAVLEYKVKAGYLFNFAKFVEWPAGAFPSESSPFVIAVLDGTEAQPVIEQVLGGKSVNGHPVQVKAVSPTTIPKDAHILLVTRAAGRTPQQIRDALGNASTLLVGEKVDFAELGGDIEFVREDESVRLRLCLEHASENGLKVSARLSSVAKLVKSKRKP